MKRTLTFFRLYAKRLLKKPSFVIILLLMPILTAILTRVIEKSDDTLKVALYDESGEEEISQVIDELVNTTGLAKFYRVSSLEDLKIDVLKNEAECGFVFTEEIYKKMIKEDADGGIIIYQSPKSSVTDYMKETVFVQVYQKLSYDRTLDYLANSPYMKDLDKDVWEPYFKEKYDQYIAEGGIFELYYTNGDDEIESDAGEVAGDKSYLKRPIKGFLAIFVMIAALSGAVFFALDEKAGIYKTLSYTERPFVNLVTIIIPSFLAVLVAFICVNLSGTGEAVLEEILRCLAFGVVLVGFANLLRALISNEVVLCSMLPTLTVVTFVCCDIFVNTAFYFEPIKYIRWLLPVNYYLDTVKFGAGIGITFLVGLLASIAGILIDKKKYMY